MDEKHEGEFLLLEEKKLMHHFMMQQNEICKIIQTKLEAGVYEPLNLSY